MSASSEVAESRGAGAPAPPPSGIRRESLVGWLLVLPAVAWTVGIVVYPLGLTVWTSLHRQMMVEQTAPFAGLLNYAHHLGNPAFWHTVGRTLVWTFGNLVLTVPVGIAVALFLHGDYPGVRFFRTWFLVPWMFPIVVVTLMWRWMLDPVVGVINYFLLNVGLVAAPVAFLSHPALALPTVIAVNSWRWIPFVAITTLAALQTLTADVREAAAIDGAGPWATFWKVVLPLIARPVTATAFLLTMWEVTMFPPIWLMTQGGPSGATTTLAVSVFVEAFQLFQMGRAAAVAVLLLALTGAFWGLYMLILRPERAAA